MSHAGARVNPAPVPAKRTTTVAPDFSRITIDSVPPSTRSPGPR